MSNWIRRSQEPSPGPFPVPESAKLEKGRAAVYLPKKMAEGYKIGPQYFRDLINIPEFDLESYYNSQDNSIEDRFCIEAKNGTDLAIAVIIEVYQKLIRNLHSGPCRLMILEADPEITVELDTDSKNASKIVPVSPKSEQDRFQTSVFHPKEVQDHVRISIRLHFKDLTELLRQVETEL